MSATAAGGEESPPLGFRSMRTLARGPGSCSGPVYRREGTFRRMYAGRLRAGAGRREPAARARFLREARLLGALRHPNVVAVLDGGELIDIGTHADLLDRCEVYRTLARTQLVGSGPRESSIHGKA